MISRGLCLRHAELLYRGAASFRFAGNARQATIVELAADMYRAAGLRQYVGDAAASAPDQPWNLQA